MRPAAILLNNLSYALGTRKPRLVLKLARNHLLVRMGRQIPRSLCIAVDYRCDLSCDHCNAKALNDRSKPAMTLDHYRSVAEQAEQIGFFNFQFTGGEPTLRKDLEEIISFFHPRKNFILVNTNAVRLDAQRIRRLKEVGVDVLSVSLDSADAAVHDAFRGKQGAWRDTVASVKLAREMGLKVALGAVVTHQNIRSPDLEQLASLTRSLGCSMQVNWACPVGAWAGNRDMLLTEADMRDLFAFLKRHHHARTDFDGNYRHHGCPAAKELAYITVQGEYLPCAFIPISYGNVTQEPLQVLRRRTLNDAAYQQYWARCPSACDSEFYEKYLKPTFGRQSPLPFEELPRPHA